MMRILPHLGDLFWMWPLSKPKPWMGLLPNVYSFFLYSYVPVSKYRMYRYTSEFSFGVKGHDSLENTLITERSPENGDILRWVQVRHPDFWEMMLHHLTTLDGPRSFLERTEETLNTFAGQYANKGGIVEEANCR